MDETQFKSKIQQMSYNTNGKPRYFIYITNAVKLLNLEKGQKVKYSINKKWEENSKKPTQIKTEEGPKKIAPAPLELEEGEEEFLVKFKDAKEINSPIAEFIFKSAVKQFGSKRVEELLNENK